MNIERITKNLFVNFGEKTIMYCVYNGYEKLPEVVESDLDIAIAEKGLQELDNMVFQIARQNNLLLLHKIWHDDKKIAYVLSPASLSESNRLQIDFFSEFSSKDFREGGLQRFYFMNESELLSDRVKFQYFYIPAPHKEFIMKFFRRISKEDLNKAKFAKLIELYNKEKDKCEFEIKNFFPEQADLIINTLNSGDLEKLHSNIQLFKKALKKFKKSNFSLRNLFQISKRAFFRIKYPVGMTVAFLGPDGCGKSTIAMKVMEVLSCSFHGQKLFYWRPELLAQPGVALKLREELDTGANPNPHGHRAENPIKSLFRFGYYLFYFIIGHWLKVWPLTIKKHLCVFDRYYYDILIDSFRYNFTLPQWLLRMPLPLIPKTDLVFILDSPMSELLRRKQELPAEELQRQRTSFSRLTSILSNTYLVDNSQSMAKVIEEITSIIILNKSYQTHASLKLSQATDDAYYFTLKKLFNITKTAHNGDIHLAIPKSDYPRAYIASSSYRVFKSSLSLYTPNRLVAKAIYKILPPWFLLLIFRRLANRVYSIGKSLMDDKIRNIFPGVSAISICTGAPGPHRKPLVQALNYAGKVLGYIKIGWNDETKGLLAREEEALSLVRSLNLTTAYIPVIRDKGEVQEGVNFLALDSLDRPLCTSYRIDKPQLAFLQEMLEKTGKHEIFGKSTFFNQLMQRVSYLDGKIPYYWQLRCNRILNALKDKQIPVCYAHGDFTPWNVFRTNDGKIMVLDWEYSRESTAFLDFFHYIIQTQVFSHKKPVSSSYLMRLLRRNITHWAQRLPAQSNEQWLDLLLIYLIDVSTFFFERNTRIGYVETDLRLEIVWSRFIDWVLRVKY